MPTITIDTTKLIQRTFEAIGFIPKAQASSQASRAYEAGYFDGMDGNDEPPSGDLRSYGYKRQTAAGLRDFTKLSHDKILEIAWTLYQSNPLAKRYFEIVKDHILGRGVEPSIADDDLRKICETFWERNNLDEQLPKFTIQKRLFGLQCYPTFVRKADGRVTLGYIDPGEIEKVQTHPENSLKPYAVILKQGTLQKRRVYRIIMKDEGYSQGHTVITPNYPDKLVTAKQARLEPWETALLSGLGLSEYTGSCFYFSVNNLSNQPLGFTDLLQVADWLDAGDETLFALADREQIAGYFSWDVTLDSIDEPQVKARAAEMRTRVPKKGQLNIHNDKEHWEMKAPDLKQKGSIETYEALSDLAWGMLGLPKPWRGLGEDSNRASATVMGEPTRKTLESKQDDIKRMLVTFLSFARDQAEIAGAWSPKKEDSGKIEITMPEMTKTDMAGVADTLTKVIEAADKALNTLKVITRKRAAEAVAKVFAEMGIEYDAAEELKEAEKEAREREAEQEKRMKQQGLMPGGNVPTLPDGKVQPVDGNGKISVSVEKTKGVNQNGNGN
jgi:hypothetical protein